MNCIKFLSDASQEQGFLAFYRGLPEVRILRVIWEMTNLNNTSDTKIIYDRRKTLFCGRYQ